VEGGHDQGADRSVSGRQRLLVVVERLRQLILNAWKHLPSDAPAVSVASLWRSSTDVAALEMAECRCASSVSRRGIARLAEPTRRKTERSVRRSRSGTELSIPSTSSDTAREDELGRLVQKGDTPMPSGLLCARVSGTGACAAEPRTAHSPEITSSPCPSAEATTSPISNL
jgi:hypothetical protein